LHAWTLAGFGSVHLPGMANSAFNTIGFPSAQRSFALLEHIFITWSNYRLRLAQLALVLT